MPFCLMNLCLAYEHKNGCLTQSTEVFANWRNTDEDMYEDMSSDNDIPWYLLEGAEADN